LSIRKFSSELETLVRARYGIIYILSWEERRVLRIVDDIARKLDKKVHTWSFTRGLNPLAKSERALNQVNESTRDPLEALNEVINYVDPAIFVLNDFHHYMRDPGVNRRLRELDGFLKISYKSLIIVSPVMNIPPELQKSVTVLDFPLPDMEELDLLLKRMMHELNMNPDITISLDRDGREMVLKAALGLTLSEAENVFAKTVIQTRELSVDSIPVILSEKEQIVKKSGVLEYYSSQENMEDIGGLENLKAWLKKRALAFTNEASKFGLPAPRGALLIGVQGCGKSLCAKAVSQLWKMPLLRFDVGRVFSSLVGSSESNVRQAISIAESVAPAILWVDEIEKAFSGMQSSGFSDAGTTARVLGTFITWLQEKTAPVFVIATANRIDLLPPELMRKGRLDEIFFVDLPSSRERKVIFEIHLKKRKKMQGTFDFGTLASVTEGFSGSEIEQVVISAMFDAFEAGTTLSTELLVKNAKDTVPLSVTMREQLEKLRKWASSRARAAS